MKSIIILICKILNFILKKIGKGSSFPGVIALKMDKNILKKLIIPNKVIAVTGSSGKGSTTSVIAQIFNDQGYKVTYNSSGSNLKAGITTTLLNNCSITGKIKSDVLILEIDERYAKYIFSDIKINTLVITNICRDQPPRQGHFNLVFEEINKSITKDMTLVLNGDDPYLRKFENKKNKIIYYGVEKNKYSYKKNKFVNLNINYCPKCNSKLNYNYYNFENNGDYYCSNCDFKKPNIDYNITSIDYINNIVCVNEKDKFIVPFNILFCIYNTLAAYTVSQIYKLNTNKAIKTISDLSNNKKIYNIYTYKKRLVTVLNNKNENSSTFNQSLLYLDRFKEEKIVIIGWKEISRRYKFNDLSWLYDIDFEILKKNNVNKIICVGINRFDIATRLKYAGIDEKNIKTFDDLNTSINYIKTKTKGNIYAVLNFDYVKPFNEYMIGSENNDN